MIREGTAPASLESAGHQAHAFDARRWEEVDIVSEMGTFYTTVGLESPLRRGQIVELTNVLVDTGAEATWMPRALLETLGITQERTELYQLADGRVLERQVGYAIVHAGGKATNDDVVFAEGTDLVLLGARSLEGLNLRVDSRRKQLVSAGPIVAALSQ